MRNIATDNTNVKIKFVHAKYRPLADTLISVFELAGWKTNLTKVPLESWLHDYITGTEVSGYNKHLVESVAKFLSDAGMIDVRAQVATEQYKHDNPTKQQWVREYIKIVIGH